MLCRRLFNTIFIVSVCGTGFAKDYIPQELTYAIQTGTTDLDFRVRYETAKQTNLKKAHATTLRSSITFESGEFNASKFRLGITDVAALFGQRYNPAVSDLSKPGYSIVRDPRGTGVTEGAITYSGFEATDIVIGRQYIQLDNERFYGKDDYRQFPQSFDAISLYNNLFEDFDLMYSYIGHVNTVYGNGRAIEGRSKLRTNLFNVSWSGYQYGLITGYLYINKDYVTKLNSSSTLGIRFTSDDEKPKPMGFDYIIEFARQDSRFNNPEKYTLHFLNFEVGKSIEALKASVGIEIRGGDFGNDDHRFRTPYGSNHNFNGWSDTFYDTPAKGLRDLYLKISGNNSDLGIYMAYHYFRLDSGNRNRRAGQEINFGVDLKLSEQVNAHAGYAKYNPKNLSIEETTRFFASISANF